MLKRWPVSAENPSECICVLDHFHDGEGFAVGEWDGDALDFDVAFEAVEWDAGEGGAHFVAGETCGARGGFDGGENQRAQAAPGECGVHEDGADFGRVDGGVEQLRFADGSAIGAEESFAFGPSAAAGQALMGFRIGVERFGYEVGLVDEELGVEAEDRAERAFDLRGSVIAGLQATDGSFNQRVERGDVCGGGQAQRKCRRACAWNQEELGWVRRRRS